MATLEPASSCDVLFPEENYKDYFSPASVHSNYSSASGSYSGDLNSIFKADGWSSKKHDYAIIPPGAKTRNRENTSGQIFHATPAVAINNNNLPSFVHKRYSKQGLNSLERPNKFVQRQGSCDNVLQSAPHRSPRSPERRYSLRGIDEIPKFISEQHVSSCSESNSPVIYSKPPKSYYQRETSKKRSINNSVSTPERSDDILPAPDNYANPYRKRVSVPEEDFQGRRRTWSPTNFEVVTAKPSNMGIGSSFQKSRRYQSNDQLKTDMGPVYEDITEHIKTTPPKITPVSGKLTKSSDKVILRPIAFKPILPRPNSYVSTPTTSIDSKSTCHSDDGKCTPNDEDARSGRFKGSARDVSKLANQDDGYISQGSHSASIVSQVSMASVTSIHMEPTERSGSSACHRVPDRPESFNSCNLSRVSSNHIEGYIQTPSPSDSGVSELEIMLREKDAEILHLRETMEHNERVIFQVQQEKEHIWQMEMQDMNDEFQRRLKHQQDKSFKMEQAFMLQVYKLQQEKKQHEEDFQKLSSEKEAVVGRLMQAEEKLKLIQEEKDKANARHGEKCCEISLLKSQIRDAKNELGIKQNENVVLQSKLSQTQDFLQDKEKLVNKLENNLVAANHNLKKLQGELENSRKPVSPTKTYGVSTQTETEPTPYTKVDKLAKHEIEQLSRDLESRNREVLKQREKFQNEKQTWLDEKDKVIRYQKQLQLNYVQMIRKNRTLESEIEQLTIELERRDLKIIEGGTGTESLC